MRLLKSILPLGAVVLLACGLNASSQTGKKGEPSPPAAGEKKVTVTLVRWPYT